MTASAASRRRRAASGLVPLLTLIVLVGCSAPSPGPPAGVDAPTAPAPAPPGALRLDGAVRRPATLDPAALSGMPQTEVTVSYQSAQGQQSRRERGVSLAALLPPDGLALDPARKNDTLTFGVLAIGADGYQALVSYGEVSPEFGNRGLLVALAEDGRPLARPRLVVPGDVKGGRYVSDLVELRVVHPTATS